MMIIALFQLLPLLVLYSETAAAAPYNPWIEGSEVGFDKFPVKRSDSHDFAAHSRRHELRRAQHEEQKRNYFRNLENREHTATHAETLAAARDLSTDVISAAHAPAGRIKGLGKRAPSDDHSQPMADWFSGGVDLMYTAPMFVGTQPQGMDIVPDTGSSDFWVPWSQSNMAADHNTFEPNNSTTFNETEYKFVQKYGLGQAEGIIGRDTVRVGGFEVTNQVLGVATAVDEQFQRQYNDGIMGFASSSMSKYPARSFFENLIVAKAIPEPYFSVFLTRGRDIQPGTRGIVDGSELCLGCLATVPQGLGATTGDMLMVPLSKFAFWQVALDSITLNGKAIAGTSGQVILDTGTTMTYLPQDIADAMLAPIGATRLSDGSYTAPASAITGSTKFGFTIGGQSFEVNPLDLVNAFTDDTRQTFLLTVSASAITGVDDEPLGILGDSFLKNVLSVYHYSYNGSPAVGIQQIALSGSTSAGAASDLPTSTTEIPRPTGQFGGTGAAAPSTLGTAATAATYAAGGGPDAVAGASGSGKAGGAGAKTSAVIGAQPSASASKGAAWKGVEVGGAGKVGVLAGLGAMVLAAL